MVQLIANERVDDIPLLVSQMQQLDLSGLIDKYFKRHGNWKGISLGKVVVGWLAYILSQGDHRLNQVEAWSEGLKRTLRACLDPALRSLDFSDDRLAAILDQFSDDQQWDDFEGEVSGQTVRVYHLNVEDVRLDTTTASGYRDVETDGLFQFGHSKDHRPDLPQVKISQAALDPLGLPVSTTVVSGNRGDDPLYVPEVKKVQRCLQSSGLMYIGDTKMAALETRGYIAESQNHYLCPLPEVQVSKTDLAELLAPVFRDEEYLIQVESPQVKETIPVSEEPADANPEVIAEGFAVTMHQSLTTGADSFTWKETWWVVHSFKQAQRQQKRLDKRIEKATEALAQLNVKGRGHKRLSLDETVAAVNQILKRYQVKHLVQVDYETITQTRHKRAYRDKPACTLTQTTVVVKSALDPEAYDHAKQLLGWRVYATNDLTLTLHKTVYGYRNEYLIERCFGRYKGKSLGLTPIYLASDERVKGLIRLLSLGLRILCLFEFSVRCSLESTQQELSGLYAGNPKRATPRPTAELLLKAFRGITLTIMEINGGIQRLLSPLSELQQQILQLVGGSDDIYLTLTG